MASVGQLGYIGVGVSDLDAWKKYAGDILGMQIYGSESDGTTFLRMDEYHHRIVLHPNGNDDIAYLGWGVPTLEALEQMAAQLKAHGVSITGGTREEAKARHVLELIKFEDPSGVPSEIYYGQEVCYPDPFNSPKAIHGFMTGDQGVGHVLLNVDDVDTNLRFYREALGMRISDFVVRQLPGGGEAMLAFLHCNARHHSMALGKLPMPKRLSHIMVQLNNFDDVGIAYDKCKDQGLPIIMSLGRHMNDHMVSFYVANPSGWLFEYGWGARSVDDDTWQVQLHTGGDIWGHRMSGPGHFSEEPVASN